MRSAEIWSSFYLDLVCLFEIILPSAEIWSSFHSDFVCLFEIVLRSAEGATVVGVEEYKTRWVSSPLFLPYSQQNYKYDDKDFSPLLYLIYLIYDI